MKKIISKPSLYYLTGMALILFDQIIKYVFVSNNFRYITNQGIAFGLFSDSRYIFVLVIASAVALIIYFVRYLDAWVIVLILSGAISNIIDRVVYQGVIDYIFIPFLPAFNIADLLINLGVLLFLYKLILEKKYLAKSSIQKQNK